MWLKFSKMHGIGNDFVVVDLITQSANIRPERVAEPGLQIGERLKTKNGDTLNGHPRLESIDNSIAISFRPR